MTYEYCNHGNFNGKLQLSRLTGVFLKTLNEKNVKPTSPLNDITFGTRLDKDVFNIQTFK